MKGEGFQGDAQEGKQRSDEMTGGKQKERKRRGGGGVYIRQT